MIRLIATDLDDTLLDADSRLTDRTVRALRRAMDAGAMVTLSSGRMTEAMVPFAEAIGVNAPMILYNGALIQDHRDGRTYFYHAIPLETARAVARAVEEMGIYLQAYPGRGYFCRKRTKYTDLYESSIRVPCGELGEKVSDWMSGDQVKLLAIAEPGIIDDAQARLRRLFPTGVCFAKSKPRYLEIVREGVDKGRAIEALARELGVARGEVMAFGDGQNDAPMIRWAGLGVAVENAVDECRRAAARIAPKNTADGVAQVVEQMLDAGEIGGAAAGEGR